MKEILLSIHQKYWDLIKTGEKTIEIRKTKPQNMFYPFRVIVYVTGGVGVVGKFDCDSITQTIRPEQFAGFGKSCLTEDELFAYAAGKPICGWHVQEKSVVEYETPFPLERATGLKQPPQSWRYLNEDEINEQIRIKGAIAGFYH